MFSDEFRNRALDTARRGKRLLFDGFAICRSEVAKIVDLHQWRAASGITDRLSAVSWPRAGIVSAGVATFGLAIYLIARPDVMAHPPQLPPQNQWDARADATDAFNTNLSPALDTANTKAAQR